MYILVLDQGVLNEDSIHNWFGYMSTYVRHQYAIAFSQNILCQPFLLTTHYSSLIEVIIASSFQIGFLIQAFSCECGHMSTHQSGSWNVNLVAWLSKFCHSLNAILYQKCIL